jgi:putative transposase
MNQETVPVSGAKEPDTDDLTELLTNKTAAAMQLECVPPTVLTLAARSLWYFLGEQVEVVKISSLTEVIVRHCVTGVAKEVPRTELVPPPSPAQQDGNSERDDQLLDRVDEAQMRRAKELEQVLIPYAAGQRLSHLECLALGKRFAISERCLRSYIKKYKERTHWAAFIRCKSGPKPGTSKLTPEVEAIIDAAIKKQLKESGAVTVNAILDDIDTRCKAIRAPTPARSSIQTRVNMQIEIPENYPAHFQEELKRAKRLVRGSLQPQGVMQMVQADHTMVDIPVKDPITHQNIGRPWITILFEIVTRIVLGFCLTLEHPSQLSTALALHRAVFPKESWLKAIGADAPWPFYGLMKCVHTDLASEFVSPWFKKAGLRYDIEIRHREGGQPQQGGHIERFLGTLMGRIHLLPGATFNHTLKKRVNRPPKYTLSTLQTWIANEIGAYHHEPHRGLRNATPRLAWERAWTTQKGLTLPVYPRDEREFLISFLPGDARTVAREGIDWKGLQYRSDALAPFIKPGIRQEFRFDKRDISSIYFTPATGQHIQIPWVNTHWDPMSLWEWDEIRLRNGERGRSSDSETVRRLRQENRRLITQQTSKSQRARRRLAREADWIDEQTREDVSLPPQGRQLRPSTVSTHTAVRFEVLE